MSKKPEWVIRVLRPDQPDVWVDIFVDADAVYALARKAAMNKTGRSRDGALTAVVKKEKR